MVLFFQELEGAAPQAAEKEKEEAVIRYLRTVVTEV